MRLFTEGSDDATGMQRAQLPDGAVGAQRVRSGLPSRKAGASADSDVCVII
jgi:hypothetical protein